MPETPAHNEDVPGIFIVFRLAKEASDGKPSLLSFQLTSGDIRESEESGEAAYLSVWAEKYTTVSQALSSMTNPLPYCWAARLCVLDITELAQETDYSPLIVLWKALRRLSEGGVLLPDDRSWAIGHAGIVGLQRPNAEYRKLRKALYDLALRNAFKVDPQGLLSV